MQVTLNRRQHIMINVGVRIPVNERANRSTQVITYFLWDWFDGGLLDGWR
jgi:ribosomal protein S2